jgi:ATP-dependent protease Clp ATPase subunit
MIEVVCSLCATSKINTNSMVKHKSIHICDKCIRHSVNMLLLNRISQDEKDLEFRLLKTFNALLSKYNINMHDDETILKMIEETIELN